MSACGRFSRISFLSAIPNFPLCGHKLRMTSLDCQWKPFWFPVGDTCQNASLKGGNVLMMDPLTILVSILSGASLACLIRGGTTGRKQRLCHQVRATFGCPISTEILLASNGRPDAPTSKPRNRAHFGLLGKIGGTIALPKRVRDFTDPKQLSPFPERCELPFPLRDGFTSWVKADPNVRKAFTEFREAFVRRQEASPQQCTKPFPCSKKAECLQLESGTSMWKRGRC